MALYKLYITYLLTPLRCGEICNDIEICNDTFIANFLASVTVEEF